MVNNITGSDNDPVVRNNENNADGETMAGTAFDSPKFDSAEAPLTAEQIDENARQTDMSAISATLPILLKQGVDEFNDPEEKRLILLSIITAVSGLLTNIFGIYDQMEIFPNLYLLVVAPPASGKGIMMFAAKLLSGIFDYFFKIKPVNEADGESESSEKKDTVRERIVVLIPANCSSAQFVTHLDINARNNAPTIVVESELDAGTKNSGSDWANNSDVYRAAFHNEPIKISRKKDKEFRYIKKPKLAMALSGTINQVKRFIPNAEDGLYTRFLICELDASLEWRDVWCKDCSNLSEEFEGMAPAYLKFYSYLVERKRQITLSGENWQKLNATFEQKLREIGESGNLNAAAIVKRHGLMLFKICMVLTAFRIYESQSDVPTVECLDKDFETAMWIVRSSMEDSINILKHIPGGDVKVDHSNRMRFYNLLPNGFTTAEAHIVGKNIAKKRSIERYLQALTRKGLLEKTEEGKYRKVFNGTKEVAEVAVDGGDGIAE